MKMCNTCRFRGVSLTGNKAWKCKQFGNIKRFNIAWLHGWLCKYYMDDSASILRQKGAKNERH